MYKKYYSYNDMPVPIKSEAKKPEITTVPDCPPTACNTAPEPDAKSAVCEKNRRGGGLGGILNNLQMDDVILILVVFALLMEDCEDKLLLAAIAFILFTS